MALALALFQKIGALSVMIILGFISVHFKIMSYEDGKALSRFALYIVTPCAMLDAFQYEFSPDKLTGMGISLLGSIIAAVVFALIAKALTKPLHLSVVDYTSLEYPNAGNLMLPLIASTMGGEWVIYCSSCFIVMNACVFTHGKAVYSGEKRFRPEMLYKNVVLLGVLAGFLMFVFNVRLPGFLGTAVADAGGMMGPIYMFTVGMIIGNADLKKLFLNGRAYMISFGRLVLCPLAAMLVICLCGVLRIHPEAPRIMLIVVLTAGAPTAVLLTQFAQLYRSKEEAEFASTVNILSTLLCIVTMPCISYLYQLIAL